MNYFDFEADNRPFYQLKCINEIPVSILLVVAHPLDSLTILFAACSFQELLRGTLFGCQYVTVPRTTPCKLFIEELTGAQHQMLFLKTKQLWLLSYSRQNSSLSAKQERQAVTILKHFLALQDLSCIAPPHTTVTKRHHQQLLSLPQEATPTQNLNIPAFTSWLPQPGPTAPPRLALQHHCTGRISPRELSSHHTKHIAANHTASSPLVCRIQEQSRLL